MTADIVELWSRRELLFLWARREIAVRYKQTALGASWALVQPLALLVIFVFLFRSITQVPSDGVPYPVFSFAGLVSWTLFANALSGAVNAVVGNLALIDKVHFPREILPLGAVAVAVVDALVAAVMLGLLMVWYGVGLTPVALLAIPLVLLELVLATAIGLWLAALTVFFRDLRHAVPILLQMWLYASPVAYSLNSVPDAWRAYYLWNPMAGIVHAFREIVLLGRPPHVAMLLPAILVGSIGLVTGYAFFKRAEGAFVDAQ